MSNYEKSVFYNMMALWGMLLVVVGHSLVPPNYYDYNSYVEGIHTWIYSFHMPLFAFVSGACFVEYSLKHYEIRRFYYNKLRRILFPYCWWILLVAFLSILFSFVAVHDRTFDVEYFLLCLIYPTKYSIISYYWFLLTISWIFMITPILIKLLYNNTCVCVVTIVLLVLSVTNPLNDVKILCLDRVFGLLFYYWLGLVVSSHGIECIIHKRLPIMILLFTLSIIGVVFFKEYYVYMKPMLACIGIWFSVLLIVHIQNKWRMTWKISYSVYLLHGLAQKLPYVFLRDIKMSWLEWLLIYTFIGVMVPVIIDLIWKKVNKTTYALLLGK